MTALLWVFDHRRGFFAACVVACLPYALIRLGDYYACRFAIDTDGMGDAR